MTASRTFPHGVTGEALAQVRWHISTRSEGGGGSCVEAGPLTDGTGRVAVRHSHHQQNGPVIVYTGPGWDAFIAGVKDNEFDFHA
ncbi:MAG TPA: DUF397 domain-containing protein [Micromonosporaceae bacterium]